MIGGVANNLIGKGTIVDCLIAGSRASCLGKTLLTFFPLGLLNLTDPAFLTVKPLFIGNSVDLSLETNSGSLALFLLVELLTLAELIALVGELLFIYTLAGLVLASLTLEMGLIPIEGLVELVIPVAAELIFIDGLVLLVLLNYLTKLPFIEFSSLRLSQAVATRESTSFFLGI